MSKTPAMRTIESAISEDIRDYLYRRYWNEDGTTTQIASELGLKSCTVSAWLKRLNIPTRDRSEASFLRFSKITEEERKAVTLSANEKVRELVKEGDFWLGGIPGENNQAKQPEARRKNSEYHKKHNPMFNEESAMKMRVSMEDYLRKRATSHEKTFKASLEKLGYFPKFQHAVCRAVLDFAFVDLKIGIEIDSFSHMNYPSVREKDIRRDGELEDEGWIILRFFNCEIEDHLGECLREVIELVNANRRIQLKEVR